MADQERFNGLTIEELEKHANSLHEHRAFCELIAAYRRVTAERDQLAARLELLRKAAGGK